jgi:hypothetical protein
MILARIIYWRWRSGRVRRLVKALSVETQPGPAFERVRGVIRCTGFAPIGPGVFLPGSDRYEGRPTSG